MKPIYSHECDYCKYLGTFLKQDLYYCSGGTGRQTLLAKYGKDVSQYTSGFSAGKNGDIFLLWVAYLMAKDKGYV